MYANMMNELDSGAWATLNPSVCPCRGSGWMLSDFDTFHKCPAHNVGQPHPECDIETTTDFRRKVNVEVFRILRGQVAKFLNITNNDANDRIEQGLPANDRSPEAWIDSADQLASLLREERMEERARAAGYSCRLEAALTTAGEAEANAVRMGMTHEAAELEGLRASQDWY